MRRENIRHLKCSLAPSLDMIGEWWTRLIIRDLFYGINNFDLLPLRSAQTKEGEVQRLAEECAGPLKISTSKSASTAGGNNLSPPAY